MTPAQRRALLALAERSGTDQRTVVATQVAWTLYGTAHSRGRGPGGRPAAAARLLDALADQGLASRDWTSPTHQAQWRITQRGLEAATTERESRP